MTVLLAVLAFVVGLVMCHYVMVKPLEETEAKLRVELRKLRGELWARGIEISNLRCWAIMQNLTLGGKTSDALRFSVTKWQTDRKIPRRDHSEFLPFDSIDDLIEGTKP